MSDIYQFSGEIKATASSCQCGQEDCTKEYVWADVQFNTAIRLKNGELRLVCKFCPGIHHLSKDDCVYTGVIRSTSAELYKAA